LVIYMTLTSYSSATSCRVDSTLHTQHQLWFLQGLVRPVLSIQQSMVPVCWSLAILTISTPIYPSPSHLPVIRPLASLTPGYIAQRYLPIVPGSFFQIWKFSPGDTLVNLPKLGHRQYPLKDSLWLTPGCLLQNLTKQSLKGDLNQKR
jgi:hypothetical protein